MAILSESDLGIVFFQSDEVDTGSQSHMELQPCVYEWPRWQVCTVTVTRGHKILRSQEVTTYLNQLPHVISFACTLHISSYEHSSKSFLPFSPISSCPTLPIPFPPHTLSLPPPLKVLGAAAGLIVS